ncbi:Peroxisomal membrane protein PEX30 [Termitomyces sp. J132]|nr:Peroxisomal membrane protein PEX30 [Termitomyces sp. J132]
MLVDLATTVPAPLAAALVPHAPFLAALRRLLQITSWESSWYDAWLAVAVWWALCLLCEPVLRYLLPVLVAVVLLICPRVCASPATEKTLQSTVADLALINSLLPKMPSIPPPSSLMRIAAVVYVPYLLLTYLIPLPILFALLGTLVLTSRAPFTALIIATLSRSAYLRHAFRYLVSVLTGEPLPQTVLSYHPTPTSLVPVPALRFLFTIYENQRWWMGLDWTAALLPGERPSWCSPPPSHAPVSPPNAFALPSAVTVFLPDGKGRRVKRSTFGIEDVHEDYPEEDHIATDADGWVYGDNKWEGPSGKGGMGKYTRYRRWTRVAIVVETVEVVDDGPVGIERPDPPPERSVPGQVQAVGTMTMTGSPTEDSPLRQRLRRALVKTSE